MSRTLGHYSITGEIGRGGMAVVYSAVQKSLNRVVALKELDLARFRSEPSALERFRLEARSAAALDHPNIVTVYDLWEDGDKVYIAMEYIDGVELKDVLIRHGAMEFAIAVRIVTEVSAALQYAHGQGMVHRDVKPGNIMLSRRGDVRLMDFGIVSVSGSGDLTVTGQILGTPAYMSPEQITGENLGPGADMFSLGVVLYEMLTGRRPFSGENQLSLIQQIMNRQPVPPADIVPELPPALSDAVLTCLEKLPEDRFPGMDSLAVELGRSLPAEAPSRKSSVTHLVEQTVDRKRPWFIESVENAEETSICRPMQGVETGYVDEGSITADSETAVSENGKKDAYSEPDMGGSSPYDLEADPPADLPPLEFNGADADEEPSSTSIKEEGEIPLSLKELPPDEPENMSVSRKGSKRRLVLLGFVPLLLVIGLAVWKFSGILIPSARTIQDLLPEKMIPASGPALLEVTAEPEARIIMDGEPLGDVRNSRTFEIEPGLHKIEVFNARLGMKNYIIEVKPGEMKQIKVKWDQ